MRRSGSVGWFCGCALAMAALLLGCRYPATEVLVVLGTDAPADRVLTVSATVGAPGSSRATSRVWVRGGNVPGSVDLPASFAVTPREPGGQDAVELRIHATLAPGARAEPAVTFDRIARFRLTSRQTGVLRVYLAMACGNHASGCTTVGDAQCTVSVLCSERGQTCGDLGACISPDVMPEPRPAGDAGGILGFDVNGEVATGVDVASDATDVNCPAETILCGGTCVSRNDPSHCGTCVTTCPSTANATATCTVGLCDFVCNAGFHRCGSACVSNADPMTCGASCVPCPSAPNAIASCDGTACTATCTAGFGDCDGSAGNGCETNLNSSPSNCSRCGMTCPGGASATCVSGVCGTSSCMAGRGECDSNVGTPCETDLTTDDANCGACGHVCGFANASARCTGGTCMLVACIAGFADCNAMPGDGCEVNTTNDVRHCGSCPMACVSVNGTPNCVAGTCSLASCNAGFHACSGMCVANNSAANCGSSCIPCPTPAHGSATCDGVSCGVLCEAGYMPSGGSCVVAMTCGNNVLEGSETCDDGNTSRGDGCYDNCHIEGDPSDACPGTVILTPGIFRGYTTSMASNFTFPCGSSGPDVAYQFFPPVNGTLRVTLTPDPGWDAILSIGDTCSGPGTFCLSTGTMGMPAAASFPVSNDSVYSILVGSNAGVGSFTLRFEYL